MKFIFKILPRLSKLIILNKLESFKVEYYICFAWGDNLAWSFSEYKFGNLTWSFSEYKVGRYQSFYWKNEIYL